MKKTTHSHQSLKMKLAAFTLCVGFAGSTAQAGPLGVLSHILEQGGKIAAKALAHNADSAVKAGERVLEAKGAKAAEAVSQAILALGLNRQSEATLKTSLEALSKESAEGKAFAELLERTSVETVEAVDMMALSKRAVAVLEKRGTVVNKSALDEFAAKLATGAEHKLKPVAVGDEAIKALGGFDDLAAAREELAAWLPDGGVLEQEALGTTDPAVIQSLLTIKRLADLSPKERRALKVLAEQQTAISSLAHNPQTNIGNLDLATAANFSALSPQQQKILLEKIEKANAEGINIFAYLEREAAGNPELQQILKDMKIDCCFGSCKV